MRNHTLAIAAIAALGACAAVRADEPNVQQMQQKMQAMQAQIDSLQQQVGANANAKDVDTTVDAVLQDADRQSQLMQADGFTAGYNKGKFMLMSSDGNFSLHPWFQFQFRDVYNYRKDSDTDGGNADDWGFELRRMKFGVDGNAFSPDFSYNFIWATSRNGGALILEEAWIKYAFADNFAVETGQFKNPFSHEALTSSKKLLAADRTLLTDTFTGGDNFVEGVQVSYDSKDKLRAAGAFTDGTGKFDQNFQDNPPNSADWGVAGRVEYLVMGDWKSYDDFTAMGTKDPLLVIGGGIDYTKVSDNSSTDMLMYTVDAQYENPNGLGVYGEFLGRNINGLQPADIDVTDWGFLVQGSYLLSNNWEPFVRYSYINFDNDEFADGIKTDISEITFGTNYYIHSHNLKFTVDVGILPNGTPVSDSGSDILSTTTNIGGIDSDHAEYYVRAQVQLLI
jgi:phosphate-selective porin OprO and OprP